ncbi:hypothetical protein M407DRAFT_243063 [Tulasnella calospora MUT 4182]|uniref:Uncharacterized protein n=1 Tax=Tulasnella calospora MUT 4182 TaxID=1051891 RepID=A0A0C3QCH5_9AGAM|nr:hypothetical protein M407DRAFT_243063 [Tulasnella calospora MUT 4182]
MVEEILEAFPSGVRVFPPCAERCSTVIHFISDGSLSPLWILAYPVATGIRISLGVLSFRVEEQISHRVEHPSYKDFDI